MADDDAAPDGFNFGIWEDNHHLNRKTCTVLHQQDMDTLPALKLVQAEDLAPLGLTTGQRRLAVAAIEGLQIDETRDIPPVVVTDQEEGLAKEPISTDIHATGLLEAGKEFDDFFKGDANQVRDCRDTRKMFLDPRTILTIKAQSKKVVHITQFLSEKTKKRRSSRRKEIVLSASGSSSDNIVIKTEDEHPYSGIFLDEWGAANCRLMNHLINVGQLDRKDI